MEVNKLEDVILYKDQFIEEVNDKNEKLLIEAFFANVKKDKVFHQLQNFIHPRVHILPHSYDSPSIKYRYEGLTEDIANELYGIYVRTALNI